MRLLLAALLLLPCLASAQSIRVRSGEHETFSRIVIALPKPSAWSLTRDGEGYRLDMAAKPQLDISRVFDLIPRRRIADIRKTPEGLRLSLGCECHAVATEMRPGLIVLDVTDGPPPETPVAAVMPRLPLPLRPPSPLPLPLAPDQPLAKMRSLIGAELTRAVDQGLVELEGAPVTSETPVTNNDAPGLAVITAFDRDVRDDGPAAPGLSACPAPELLDPTAWMKAEPLAETLGKLRAELVGEFDRPGVEAVNTLVRYYLAMGFGHEALAEMQLNPDLIADREWLLPLAALVDGEIPRDIGPLAAMAACDGWTPLWALLADPRLGAGREVNRGAVLRSFSRLAPFQRDLLGPRLVERFLARDDDEAALSVRSAMARADEGPSVAIADGLIAREEREPPGLAPTSRTSGVLGAEALALLIEGRVARGEPVEHERAVQAAALAMEMRGAQLGDRLARAEVLALASTGDFDAAYGAFDRLPASLRRETGETLATLLLRIADDVTFLRFALGSRLTAPDLPISVQVGVEERVTALGFGRSETGPGRAETPATGAVQAGTSRAGTSTAQPSLSLAGAGALLEESRAFRRDLVLILNDPANGS